MKDIKNLDIAYHSDIQLVDRSDSDFKCVEMIVLNSDCPKSPIAALRSQSNKGHEEQGGFVDLSLVFKSDDPSLWSINRKLRHVSHGKIGNMTSSPMPDEPSTDFLRRATHSHAAASTYYPVLLVAKEDAVGEVLEILYKEGLIGETAKKAVSRFAAAVGNKAARDEGTVIDVEPAPANDNGGWRKTIDSARKLLSRKKG